ncbi:MAG: histone [archaeon]
MVKDKSEIPDAPMDRILRDAGAKRVSKSGARQFAVALEGIASDISREAIVFAKHAGRKTVINDDIKLAAKKIGKTI